MAEGVIVMPRNCEILFAAAVAPATRGGAVRVARNAPAARALAEPPVVGPPRRAMLISSHGAEMKPALLRSCRSVGKGVGNVCCTGEAS